MMDDYKQGGHFDNLYQAGTAMGFARGGKVSSQPTMDHGVQPARGGCNEREVEAGGTPKLKPTYKDGGKVKKKKGKKKKDPSTLEVLGKIKKSGKQYKAGSTDRMAEYGLAKGGSAKKAKGGYNSKPMYGK